MLKDRKDYWNWEVGDLVFEDDVEKAVGGIMPYSSNADLSPKIKGCGWRPAAMLSVADRIESLLVRVEKINVCHVGGGPQGGQFCAGSEGGATSGDGASVLSPTDVLKDGSKTWRKSLSLTEKGAVQRYSSNDFVSVNGALRGPLSSNYEKGMQVQKLDEAISKYKLPVDTTVYRGVQPPLSDKFKIGTVFSDKAYVSTSVSSKVAERFGSGGVVLRIKVPKGSSAAPMDGFSKYPKEGELLLSRNVRFRITGQSQGFLDVEVM